MEQFVAVPKHVTIPLDGWQCSRCGHRWVPRSPGYEPETCPRCKSPFWKVPRQNRRRTKR